MTSASRFFVTGTDTDVGKTWVTAALARALRITLPREIPVSVVKAVQTGLEPGSDGDAATAARLAGPAVAALELARFRKPADPYSAALAEGRRPCGVRELGAALERVPGAVVIEGAGGAAVPLNPDETIAHLAAALGRPAVVAVGLRLGCISHARLTAAYLGALGIPVAGAVAVERWGPVGEDYRRDVARGLAGVLPLLAWMPYAVDPERAIAPVAEALQALIATPTSKG